MLNGFRYGECILVGHAKHFNQCGGLSLKPDRQLHILKAVAQNGDLPQGYLGAVRIGKNGHIPIFIGIIPSPFGTDQYLSTGCFYTARRQIQTSFSNGIRHPAKGQPIPSKGFLGDFNMNFTGLDSGKIRLGNTREVDNFVLDGLRQILNGGLGDIPIDRQADDPVPTGHFPHNGPFRLIGEGGDTVHLAFHLIQQFFEGPVFHNLDGNRPQTFPGGGIDPLDACKTRHPFLDAPNDGFFNLRGRSTGIRGGHRNHIQGKLGENLHLHGKAGNDTRQHEKQHEQIGGDVVFRKPGDHPFHPCFSSLCSTGRMVIPSVTVLRWDMTT